MRYKILAGLVLIVALALVLFSCGPETPDRGVGLYLPGVGTEFYEITKTAPFLYSDLTAYATQSRVASDVDIFVNDIYVNPITKSPTPPPPVVRGFPTTIYGETSGVGAQVSIEVTPIVPPPDTTPVCTRVIGVCIYIFVYVN